MDRTKPLFLVGNKRSGTSHLVRLLNLHPEVFVTHESDAVWILHQWAAGRPFACYPWDGPLGMEATLAACGDLLDADRDAAPSDRSIAETFFRIGRRLMRTGSPVKEPHPAKGDLAWLGDKKPVQQADPALQPFLRAHFPEARYVHIVRHPRMTVASTVEAGRTWAKVAYWRDGSPAEILERWAIHEEWVLALRDRGDIPVFSLRFEDLGADPVAQMAELFAFLGLAMPPGLASAIRAATRADTNQKHAAFPLPASPRARAVMDRYGYA
jgi:hypothetical protein